MTDPDAPPLTPFQRNQKLMHSLVDDDKRDQLYEELRASGEVIQFQSMAQWPTPPGAVPQFHQCVALLTAREHVELALRDDSLFSNAPYQPLGSGTFMLGLDGMAHALQRGLAARLLRYSAVEVGALIEIAWAAAAVQPLKSRRFDAAALGEQVGLRFAALLFGYPLDEHGVLELSMRAGYRQLVHQIIGRHFGFDPSLKVAADQYGAAFLMRTQTLLQAYANGEPPADVVELRAQLGAIGKQRGIAGLEHFSPVAERLVADNNELSGHEMASLMGGLIAGTIGNMQASVAIALQALLLDPAGGGRQAELVELATKALPLTPERGRLQRLIVDALAQHPPAAFLPRQVIAECSLMHQGRVVARLQPGQQVVLAIGAATREAAATPGVSDAFGERGDPLIFGGSARSDGAPGHDCIGAWLALPLVVETVRRVLMLPGINASLDPTKGEPERIRKTWGFRCDQFWLEYSRERACVQNPLSVIMPIKAPLAENANKLRLTIAAAAPRIEFKLDEAAHVHFAWFLLLEGDSKLGLFTTFDGPFDEYLKHFARKVGPLFDKLLEYLDDAPPLPVEDNIEAFVARMRKYNATPVGNYFYSAYPRADAAAVRQALKRDNDRGRAP